MAVRSDSLPLNVLLPHTAPPLYDDAVRLSSIGTNARLRNMEDLGEVVALLDKFWADKKCSHTRRWHQLWDAWKGSALITVAPRASPPESTVRAARRRSRVIEFRRNSAMNAKLSTSRIPNPIRTRLQHGAEDAVNSRGHRLN